MPPPAHPDSGATNQRRRAIAFTVAALWIAALTLLTVTTSNPVTLNREQILRADAVVSAQVLDVHSGACRIEHQWSGTPLEPDVIVQGLEQTAATTEGLWILPLTSGPAGLEVERTLLPSGARLVYPATPQAVRQLEQLLGPAARTTPAE